MVECSGCGSFIENITFYVCHTCDLQFCQACADVHIGKTNTDDHLVLYSNGLDTKYCTDHLKIAFAYCPDCKSVLCQICLLDKNSCDHNRFQDYCHLQLEYFPKIYELINETEDLIKSHENSISGFSSLHEDFIGNVEYMFKKLHRFLDETQNRILNDVKLKCGFFTAINLQKKSLKKCVIGLATAKSLLNSSFLEEHRLIKINQLPKSKIKEVIFPNSKQYVDYQRIHSFVEDVFNAELPCEIAIKKRKFSESEDDEYDTSKYLHPFTSLDDVINNLDSKNEDKTSNAFRVIKNGLNVHEMFSVDELINAGIMPVLFRCLQPEYDELPDTQSNVCWLLTDFTYEKSHTTLAVVGIGCIPYLIRLANSQRENVNNSALWALGNIICDSVVLRDSCIAAGVLLIGENQLFNNPSCKFRTNFAFLLSTICHPSSVPIPISVLKQVLDFIKILLKDTDHQLLMSYCFGTLSFICEVSDEFKQEFFDYGFLEFIVKYFESAGVVDAALFEALSSFSKSERFCHFVFEVNILPHLIMHLKDSNDSIKEKVLAIFEGIASLGAKADRLLADSNVHLLHIISNLLLEDDDGVVLAAAKVFNFLFKFATPKQIEFCCISLNVFNSLIRLASLRPDKIFLSTIGEILRRANNSEYFASLIKKDGVIESLKSALSDHPEDASKSPDHFIDFLTNLVN